MIKLLSLASLLLCASPVLASEPWTKYEGQRSGIAEARFVGVTDQAAWEKLWREHDAQAAVPAVDFSKESVAAAFLGERPTGGIKVELVIQSDPLDPSRLNAFYREIRSSKGFATTVVSRPFIIVKVRKAAVIAFERDARLSLPGETAPANPRDERRARALIDSLGAPSFDGR